MLENNKKVVVTFEQWNKLYDLIISTLDIATFKNDQIYLQQLSKAINILKEIDENNDETFTVDDVALYLNISTKTVLRMIHDGRLQAHKKGKFYFISEKSVMKYKDSSRKIKENKVSIETLKLLGIVKGE